MKHHVLTVIIAVNCISPAFAWEPGDIYVPAAKVEITDTVNLEDENAKNRLMNILAVAPENTSSSDSLNMDNETLDRLQRIYQKLLEYDEAYSKQIVKRFSTIPEPEFTRDSSLYPYGNIITKDDRHSANYINFDKVPLFCYDLIKPDDKKRILVYSASYPLKAPHYPEVRRSVLIRLIVQVGEKISCTALPPPDNGLWVLAGSSSDPFYLGCVKKENTDFPDIFVLMGPGGSGNFFEICRYSYHRETGKWESVVVVANSGLLEYSIDRDNLIFHWKSHDGEHNIPLKQVNI